MDKNYKSKENKRARFRRVVALVLVAIMVLSAFTMFAGFFL